MGQQEPASLREALSGMGFSIHEINHVVNAGIDEVSAALDFIQNNPLAPIYQGNFFEQFISRSRRRTEPTIPDINQSKTSFEAPDSFPPLQHGNITSLSNARNSLDGIDMSRSPMPHHQPPVHPPELVDQKTDRILPNFSDFQKNNKFNTGVELSSTKTQSHLSVPQTTEQQDDDLKRALQLSREDQHERELKQALRISKQHEQATTAFNIEQNDPDFLRAVEESLKENPNNRIGNADPGGTDRLVSWQSHAYHNTQNLVRENLEDPVGLRNIGNTCYLNSLLQVYFYLPEFRRAVLSFRAPAEFDNEIDSGQHERTTGHDTTASSAPAALAECGVTETAPTGTQPETSPTGTQPETSLHSAPPTTNIHDDCAERKSESTSGYAVNSNETSADLDNRDVDTAINDTALQPVPATTMTADPRSTTTPTPNPSPVPTPISAPPAPGETSISDKSDNRSERIGESERTSKRHAVEFVIELQRLFAAMALGKEACVDPTSVARSMRSADGMPIKIGDQQDASEFNHLFLDIVERGLRGDIDEQPPNTVKDESKFTLPEDLRTTSGDATGATTTAATSAAPTIDANQIGTQSGQSKDTAEPCNQELDKPSKQNDADIAKQSLPLFGNVVKDLFTVKFRQEVRRCEDNERGTMGDAGNKSVTDVMMSEGETNCIIVDATTSKERDLYSGLDDYAIARIEYNAATTSDTKNKVSDGTSNVISPDSVSGQDATVAAIAAIKEDEQGAATTNSKTSTIVTPTIDMKDLDADGDNEMPDVKRPSCDGTNEKSPTKPSTWGLKSVWLTKLPPVLVVYLQRVRYNLEKSTAEKVHDKYEFSPEIALDRYLDKNREASGGARERVSGIRKERKRLSSLIRRYRSFPAESVENSNAGESTFSTDGDVMMMPASSSPTSSSNLAAPGEKRKLNVTFSGINDEESNTKTEWRRQDGEIFQAGNRIHKRLTEALNPTSELFAVGGISKENVDVALHTIERVLESDHKKCERLKDALSALEPESHVYKGLDKERYRLHAVLVHDGAPSSGHYWTFIRDWRVQKGSNDRASNGELLEESAIVDSATDGRHQDSNGEVLTWIKFSDSLVRRVSENEMLLWSSGGHGHASAYCLIYRAAAIGDNVKLADGTYSDAFVDESVNGNIADECRQLLPASWLEEIEHAEANAAIDVDAETSIMMNTGDMAHHAAEGEKNTTVTVVEDEVKLHSDVDGYTEVELKNQTW